MAFITDTSIWETGIYKIETSDLVIGGNESSKANIPHLHLNRRVNYLLDAITGALATAIDIKFKSSVTADIFVMDESVGKIALGTSSFPTGAGLLHIDTPATPLTFFETSQTGAGAYHRISLDSKILSFDVSQNGTDFTTATTGIAIGSAGTVGIGSTVDTTYKLDISQNATTGRNLRLSGDFASTTQGGEICFADKADANAYFIDVDTNGILSIRDSSANPFIYFDDGSNIITINPNGDNIDFIVEGDTDPNLITVDAGQNNVGFGTSPNANYLLDISSTAFSRGINIVMTGASVTGVYSAITSSTTGGYGGYFSNSGNATARGIYASGVERGIDVTATATDGYGVYSNVAGATATAIRGISAGTIGISGTTSNSGTDVYGVSGTTSAGTGVSAGVYGLSTTGSSVGTGVRGYAAHTTGVNFGGWFQSVSTSGTGVYGIASAASGTTYGVYGKAISASGYALYAEGDLHVTGDASCDGSVASWSDKTLKTNIKVLNSVVTSIRKNKDFNVHEFTLKNSKSKEKLIGPIAQDIKKVFGYEYYDKRTNKMKLPLNFSGSLALKGVIELVKEIDKLKEEIDKLKGVKDV